MSEVRLQVQRREGLEGVKPAYAVPSMAEIAATPDNGYRLVSTFSGAGGSCLGFRMAGFRTLWASEFIEAARETYAANFPGISIDARDIRKVTARALMRGAGVRKGELDVLEGSPPCASFSTAGRRSAHWGEVKKYSDTRQRTDDLFFEFARLLEGVQPKVFVAENVAGLVRGVAKGYFIEIFERLESAGYVVQAKLLDAQWLGVPQHRERIFFVGVRRDLGVAPAFPKPLPYRYSIRDAVPWIVAAKHLSHNRPAWKDAGAEPSPTIVQSGAQINEKATQSGGTYVEALPAGARFEHPINHEMVGVDEPAPTVVQSRASTVEPEIRVGRQGGNRFNKGQRIDPDAPLPTVQSTQAGGEFEIEPETRIEGYAIAEEYDRLREGEGSDRYQSLVKAKVDAPSPTVMQAAGSPSTAGVVHPTERRKFSIGELKRVCSFPDDFVLTGTFSQQWERLGRAVPPLMAYKIAAVIRDEILAKL